MSIVGPSGVRCAVARELFNERHHPRMDAPPVSQACSCLGSGGGGGNGAGGEGALGARGGRGEDPCCLHHSRPRPPLRRASRGARRGKGEHLTGQSSLGCVAEESRRPAKALSEALARLFEESSRSSPGPVHLASHLQRCPCSRRGTWTLNRAPRPPAAMRMGGVEPEEGRFGSMVSLLP